MTANDVYATLAGFKVGQKIRVTFYGYRDEDGDIAVSDDVAASTGYLERGKLARFEVESIEPVARFWKPGDVVLMPGGNVLFRQGRDNPVWKSLSGAKLSPGEVDETTLTLVVRDGEKV